MADTQQNERPRFFICPVCFQVAPRPIECHGHTMIPCTAETPEDCKPPMSPEGELQSRAPRWFLEEVARLRE